MATANWITSHFLAHN